MTAVASAERNRCNAPHADRKTERNSARVNQTNKEFYSGKKKETKRKCSVTLLVSNKDDHHLSGWGGWHSVGDVVKKQNWWNGFEKEGGK